jgi:hypothetical protein
MAQPTTIRCDPEEVRCVVESIYLGEITPAEGEEICLKSSDDLAHWARELPPNLHNNASTSGLRRATNKLLGIEERVHWEVEEMRVAIREVLINKRHIAAVAKETCIRKYCTRKTERTLRS